MPREFGQHRREQGFDIQLQAVQRIDRVQQREEAVEAVGGGLSGYLSAAQGQDESVYQALEQSFLEILNASQIARFDASDLMPADVGAGTFWTEGTSLDNGDVTAQEAATTIEASWPN